MVVVHTKDTTKASGLSPHGTSFLKLKTVTDLGTLLHRYWGQLFMKDPTGTGLRAELRKTMLTLQF